MPSGFLPAVIRNSYLTMTGVNSLECSDLSPLWSSATCRRCPRYTALRVFCNMLFHYRRLRQVADDQSSDRSAHSKELPPPPKKKAPATEEPAREPKDF